MTTAQKQELAHLLLETGAVQFGNFVTKSGRFSPYFVNLESVCRGDQISRLTELFSIGIMDHFSSELPDCLFGPAYKAIPLAITISMSASKKLRRPVFYSFNRKEAKTHGKTGSLVGRQPNKKERVLIIDDVVTDNNAKREAIELLKNITSARICGLLIAVDRMERGNSKISALQQIGKEFSLPTAALITIEEIIQSPTVSTANRTAVIQHLNKHRGQ